jgi:Amt family ammonium transporter
VRRPLCALFASPENLRAASKFQQILIQLLGVAVNFVWAFGIGLLIFFVIDRTIGLRVSKEEEEKGLNIAEFSDLYSWYQKLVEEHYET